MRPEMPYLASGAIALIGGAIKERGWPINSFNTVVGTVALVILASATSGTKISPLVRAVGLLIALSATIAAVNATLKVRK